MSFTETLASSVDSTHDCYFVPALQGYFFPFWQDDARGYVIIACCVKILLAWFLSFQSQCCVIKNLQINKDKVKNKIRFYNILNKVIDKIVIMLLNLQWYYSSQTNNKEDLTLCSH